MNEQIQKTAIITGASRGIGAAIATRMAHDGFNVIINYANDDAAANRVLESLPRGANAVLHKGDICDANVMRAMFDKAEDQWGGVDALINNAGIMKLAPMAECDDDLFDAHIGVNIKGVFNGMREAAKRLREGGHIVSFSTSVVGLYLPGYGVYAATKAAVEAMTHVLSKELGPKNIKVNAIAPGPTSTDLFLDGKDEATIERIKNMTPFKRLGTPEEIANAVSFLVSEKADWINGQIIKVNGGII